MKMSALGTPLTWMPADEIKVRLRRRWVERTAISSAIQPPSDCPYVQARKAERLDGIEIKIGHVGHVIDPARHLG